MTMGEGTRVVRAGLPAPVQGAPFLPGPAFAGTYHLTGDPASAPYTYGRYHNPTWSAYEAALAELEGGPAVAFASGMAAVAATLGAFLRPGDSVVLPADGYYTARLLADDFFAPGGVEVRRAPTAGDAQASLLAGATLLWLESPSNPGLDVCDIARLAELAHAQGALVAVDNTTATPLGQQPLALGADFSVASDSKALTGHADVILGHVAMRDPAHAARLQQWRSQMGAVPGPFEVWLAHRSLATLDLRLERQATNALAIAGLLQTHAAVQRVRYPGLPADPAYAVARRQMRRYGPVVSFTLAGEAEAEQFLGACRLVWQATSFGGVQTTAERRARWGGDAVPAGFIRLSAGCEDAADLLADIGQVLDALETTSTPPA